MEIIQLEDSSGNFGDTEGYTILSPSYSSPIHPMYNNSYQVYITDIIIEVPLVRCFLVALQIIAIILASIGNGLLIIIVVKHWRKHRSNVTAYLVLNLATTEFIRTVFHQPMRLVDILLPQAEFVESDLVYCKASGFFSAFFAGVAFHTIVGISIERLMLICYPLHAKGVLTVTSARRVIVSIWIIAFVATLPLPVFFTFVARIPLKDRVVSFCLIDIVAEGHFEGRVYYVALFFLYYAIPVLVITTAYARIFCTLNKDKFLLSGTTGLNQQQDDSMRKILVARRSLAKIMLSIAIIFTVFQGPYFLTFLCLCLGVKVHSNHIFVLLVIEFLPLVSSVLNPVIYTANSTSWRKGLLGYRPGSSAGEEGPQRGSTRRQISAITKIEGTFRLKPVSSRDRDNGTMEKACIAEIDEEDGAEATVL